MTYLSDLVGKTLVDVNEAPLGVIEEVIARAQGRVCGPRVTAVVARQEGVTRIFSALGFARISGDKIHLRYTAEKALKHVPTRWEIYLVRDLLGRQVIDFTHAHAGRIHDVKMEWFEGALFLTQIDIGVEEAEYQPESSKENWPEGRRFRRNRMRSLIYWKDFELLPEEAEEPQRYKAKPAAEPSRLMDETLVATD